ncbi:glycoside hydrolase family 3 N-terminal domain-containing protein [Geodermatophilus aquaeductus]|uniref:Beta-N-acetylhexosaminidase n=1 Tax=Geodermatophilus aquaeductus TaxID=1564161 RepID=A0A521FMZ5_9ACTN|nr:glycoside hydrolase family 3 N-terminal domain-containing protein [Geodermatophilus aquaeductus]SMO97585.1 beta-N-acetylhexosaminidase [Geodermatophilus aquaeductus]
MSELDDLVDSCLVPGFSGPEVPGWVADALGRGMAGVCVYGANLTAGPAQSAPERVRAISDAVHAAAPDALVTLDEEGGDVTRLDYLVGSGYPGNLALGVVDDVALTRAVATAVGADLRRAGVDVDLAPSVDVNSDPRNPVIGVRSFGADPALVARHGAAFVAGLQAAGVAACAKHFPGHGATTVDSHLGLPVVDVDPGTARARELPPFTAAVAAGAELVMTSHVVFPAVDAQPATLSRRWLVDVLRGELGFDGVVVTDALDMAGVRAAHGIAGAGALSLAAGADLLLVGAEDGEEHCAAIRRAVAAAVREGRLTEARLHEAVGRVRALRERQAARAAGAVPEGDPGAVAARRALRLRDVVPLAAPAVVVELRGEANMAVGDARWSLADPLAGLGLLAEAVTVRGGDPAPAEVAGRAGGRPLVVAVRDAYRHPDQRGWLQTLLAARHDAVVVVLGMPDDAGLTTGPVLTTHGAARVLTQAAAEALAGRALRG